MKKTKEEKNNRRTIEGMVVSNKMQKAVVVKVISKYPHPKYGKIITKVKKFYARSEDKCEEGDTVVIRETKPLSKLIRWEVIERK